MEKYTSKCSSCPYRGYSREICQLHGRMETPLLACTEKDSIWASWGKKAAIGAGVGITGMVAGMAVLPALGIKGILGHFAAVKLSGAGGLVGASANMAMNRKSKAGVKRKSKKKSVLLPKHFGGVGHERKK